MRYVKNAKAYGGTPQTNGLKLHETLKQYSCRHGLHPFRTTQHLGYAYLAGETHLPVHRGRKERAGLATKRPIRHRQMRLLPSHVRPVISCASALGNVLSALTFQTSRTDRCFARWLKIGLITSTLQAKKSDEATLLFNLQGVRISKPAPGQIYLRNGKKFIAR